MYWSVDHKQTLRIPWGDFDMFRLIAATLAALYGILYVFGDEARRPAEVSRAEPLGFEFLSTTTIPAGTPTGRVHVSEISDREAIDLALAAGKSVRDERKIKPSRTVAVAAVSVEPAAEAPAPAAEDVSRYWYVTGSRVNLRGGPSTSDAVVGQVTLGTEAEVLADADGWYQIRLADGSASGWIFGKFLDEKRAG